MKKLITLGGLALALENHCLCQSFLFRFSCYLVQSAGGISFQSRVAKTWVK